MLNSLVTFIPLLSPQAIEPLIESTEARMVALERVLGPGAADVTDMYKDGDGNTFARHPYVTGGEIVAIEQVDRVRADHHFAVHQQIVADFRQALLNSRLAGYVQHPSHGGWFRLSSGYWFAHGEMDATRADLVACAGAAGYDPGMEGAPIFFSRADVAGWVEAAYAEVAPEPAPAPSDRNGFAGAPSVKHLLPAMMRQRANDGTMCRESFAAEAAALAAMFNAHPDYRHVKRIRPKTIQNDLELGSLYRELMASRN